MSEKELEQLQYTLEDVRAIMKHRRMTVKKFGSEIQEIMGTEGNGQSAYLSAHRWLSGKAVPNLRAYLAIQEWILQNTK